MRFMVITKATADSEAGRPPTTETIETMGAFIQEMVDAGVLLAADGIHPSSKGVRIYFGGKKDGEKTVVDGPFAETKELIAGFFIVETKTIEECVEWFKRCPVQPSSDGEPTNIEIRPILQIEDLGDEITAEQREAVERREQGARYN
jgi:hypothetical protein